MRRRHHPAHAEQGTQFFGLPGTLGPGTDHLLERHHVRVDASNPIGDAARARALVKASTAVDVVGGDPERAPAAVRGHGVAVS